MDARKELKLLQDLIRRRIKETKLRNKRLELEKAVRR
jgi:hypothetical protein